MTQTTLPQTRWQEIEKLWKDNRWLYVLAGILIGIVSVPAIEQITGDLNTLIGNLVPETIGIIFTVLILNRVADNRAQDDLKHQLQEDLKSTSVAPAVNALERLRREEWLDDDYFVGKNLRRANWEEAYIGGLNFEKAKLNFVNFKGVTSDNGENNDVVNLQDAHLLGANLQDAHLMEANLQEAHLMDANLQAAQLVRANLQMARLLGANLQAADLWWANLQDAHLVDANLQGAHLLGANLQAADLEGANLQDAHLVGANLQAAHLRDAQLDNIAWASQDGSYATILPDGIKWSSEEDMKRFTDPNHSEFEAALLKINAIRRRQGREPIDKW